LTVQVITERQQDFHEAVLDITSELSLDKVFAKAVEHARELTGARYAGLEVPNPAGGLEQFVSSGLTKVDYERMESLPCHTGRGLVGALFENGETIRLENLHASEKAVGYPKAHPEMTSFLGVPIRTQGETVAVLYLTDKAGGTPFTDVDQDVIERFARYAASAIENARLYEQVQRIAILEERERIGMDLHDGIIQSIYAVGLTLEHGGLLLDEDGQDNKAAARERVRGAIDGLNQIIRDIRNYILDLRPQKLRAGDLLGSLQRLIREFRANTLAEIVLDVDKDLLEGLDERTSTALFHIAQEALANAAKHAGATKLEISIFGRIHHVILQVSDNGIGFEIDETQPIIGHGLSNMEMRATAAGGRLSVESVPDVGTIIVATLPAHKEGSNGM
jgi:signal transduction histidine kinase